MSVAAAGRRRAGSDNGSVLVLGIGLVGICMLALVVLTDATSAFLQRRQLFAVADAAALAAAQAVDLESYYEQGAHEGTRLESGSVVSRARGHLLDAGRVIPGLQIDRIRTDGITVVVDISAPVRLPFLGALRTDVVRVSSTARLDYRPGA